MMIGFNCDVVTGVVVVVGAAVVVVGAVVEVVGAAVVVVGAVVVVVGVVVVVVGAAVVAWSACGLGSATSLELLPHDAVSRLIARTHDPQSLRPAHLMPDSSPRPTKRYRLRVKWEPDLYINLLSRPHRAVGAHSGRGAQVPRCPLRPQSHLRARLGHQ